jgi:hypothetical protein
MKGPSDTGDRLYRLRHVLDGGRCVTRGFLLRALGVSPSTPKRDIAELRDQHNAPVEWDAGRGDCTCRTSRRSAARGIAASAWCTTATTDAWTPAATGGRRCAASASTRSSRCACPTARASTWPTATRRGAGLRIRPFGGARGHFGPGRHSWGASSPNDGFEPAKCDHARATTGGLVPQRRRPHREGVMYCRLRTVEAASRPQCYSLRRRVAHKATKAAPDSSMVAGSGTPPGVAEPKVMSSKPVWLAVPPKSMDFAMPTNETPTGVQLQKEPVGSPVQLSKQPCLPPPPAPALPDVAVAGDGPYLIDREGAATSTALAARPCPASATATRRWWAVREQVAKLEYAHTSFMTSEPAEALADDLVAGARPGSATSTSSAAAPRRGGRAEDGACSTTPSAAAAANRFIARWQSYHGNTLGALSAGGNRWRRAQFAPLLRHLAHRPATPTAASATDESAEAYGLRLADELEAEIQRLGADRSSPSSPSRWSAPRWARYPPCPATSGASARSATATACC